jgi:hypothetical protein
VEETASQEDEGIRASELSNDRQDEDDTSNYTDSVSLLDFDPHFLNLSCLDFRLDFVDLWRSVLDL